MTKSDKTEIGVIRWMCRFTCKNGKENEELWDMSGACK